MGKLIKYEFKKQMLSKIIVGVLVLICQLVMLVGVFADKPDWGALGFGGMTLLAFAALFYFSFETVVTYSNDLKTKQSYMLFLVPRNMYQVVGAKMITTIAQIFVAGIAFMALILGNLFLVSARDGEIEEFIKLMKMFIEFVSGVNVDVTTVVYVICSMLVVWIEFVLMAMLAITLSTTLFANKRYKGVISFGIYIGLEFVLGKIADWASNGAMSGEVLTLDAMAWVYMGVYVVAMVLCFFGTAWLLDKKISV